MRRTRLACVTGAVILAIMIFIVAGSLMKTRTRPEQRPDMSAGALLFQNKGCIQCHYPDQTTSKVGPGLKGLLKSEKLTISGEPATRDNVRQMMVDPYDRMPSYRNRLSEDEMRLLLDYLDTL